jgi:hypothetical protein
MRGSPTEDLRLDVLDREERTGNVACNERMLEALMREHPERFTTDNPPGTKAPRRLLPPIESGLTTNFD